MARIAFDPTRTVDFSLPDDQDEPRTIFELGVLDEDLFNYITDFRRQFGVNRTNPNGQATVFQNDAQANALLVRFGVKGWRNYSNAQNRPVVVQLEDRIVPNVGVRKGLTDEAIMYLRGKIDILAREVEQLNLPTEESEKNS
jgi:hypothetical protein